MTKSMTTSIIATAAIAVLASACGKSAEQQQAEQAAEAVAQAAREGASQMAEGAATMAQGLEALTKGVTAAGGKVDVVDFEVLGAAFPELSGWQRSEVTGTTTSFPMAMSQSEVSYQQGEARVKLAVIDTALNQMLFAPFAMYMSANFSERSSDGYKKGTSVKGEPGFEDVNTRRGTATVTVVVGKRFIVTSEGSRGAGIEPVRAALEQMDFSKLTAAK